MNNELAYKRCSVDGEGKIKIETGDIRLRLIDISAAGALITVPKMLSIKKRYNVQLMFDISIIQMQLKTEAEIVSLEENDDGQYVYDICFPDLKNSERIEIDEAINHNFVLEDEDSLLS